MDITVLELHLPEATFNNPFSSGSRNDNGEIGERPPTEDESGGRSLSGVAAIAVLVGLAALAWYLRSGRGRGVEADDMMAEQPA